MKTSFKSNEIAHIWAHESAPRGTSPGGMGFNGPAFLSYGTEIGRHITFKGNAAIIYNETSYSVTTSKHQGILKRSIPASIPVFYIGGCARGECLGDIGGAQLFEYALQQVSRASAAAEKARNKEPWQALQAQWLERAGAVNEFFSLRRKVDAGAADRFRRASAATERKARIAREKREKMERDIQQRGYEEWKLGIAGEYFNERLFPVAFRVESDELVSTLGARVPMDAARVALRFILSRRETGWQRNGSTCAVGNYQLDAINAQGVVAGCHRITWEEVDRLSPVLSAQSVTA